MIRLSKFLSLFVSKKADKERVKRGLFRTKDGILLNADVNGSYNIMRKVKGDAVMPPYTGFGYNPVKKFIN